MFLPEHWPAYYSKSKGVEVWDMDGNKFIDATYCGVGAPILGFADPDVERAVIEAVKAGTTTTLNCPEEVELADLLLELHPWAEMVRYSRTGGEIMAIAVRIARAATGKDKIAFCGYHGWHDWYISANLAEDDALDGHLLPGLDPAGVPRGLAGTMFPFHYNQINELRAIVDEHGPDLGVIVMEPARGAGPDEGFLEEVRAIATRIGAVLIFDEVTSGWRMNTGGIHLTYGVNPDMAAFAKAMANGFPMAAVIGTRSVMEAAQGSFISSSGWTEKIGPAAALATINKHRRLSVPQHLIEIGAMVQKGWREAANAYGLNVQVSGIPPLSTFTFQHGNPAAMATVFTQEMLAKGFLASTGFYAINAHQTHHIEAYIKAVGEVFILLKKLVENEEVEQHLNGPVRHTGFYRLA
ncbi:MAG: aminotransferase class III-fold pyridoxal phosphate-dependent enzyme [SAR202 cluster bacterium]|nr:aminotransferase class III-fold pyridoxal phosphate-dependent enzyme [SAR202 cluster bacterium]